MSSTTLVGAVETLLSMRSNIDAAVDAASKATASGIKVTTQYTAAQQRAAMAMAGVHDQALAMDRALDEATEAVGKWTDENQRAAMAMTGLHDEALRMNAELAKVSKLDGLASGLETFGHKASSAGRALLPLSIAIGAVGGIAIKMAMDAVESENLFSVAFKDMADSARDWSERTNRALGLNAFELRKQSGMIFTMVSSMGLGKQAAFDMATGMTTLAADMASFFNLKPEEAFEKLRAGITGEAEPLKRLGILVDEATVKQAAYTAGLVRHGAELTQQDKVAARWLAILNQTKDAQGDLARTPDSPTNQLRLMREQVNQLTIELGMALLPAFQQVLGVLRDLMPHLQGAVKWFAELSPPARNVAIGIVAIAAAAGPTLIVLGAMTKGAADLIRGFSAVAKVVPGLVAKIGLLNAGAKAATLSLGTLAAAGAVGVGAFFVTKWIMEITGARAALDGLIDKVTGLKAAEQEAGEVNARLARARAADVAVAAGKAIVTVTNQEIAAAVKAADQADKLAKATKILGKDVTDLATAERVLAVAHSMSAEGIARAKKKLEDERKEVLAAQEAHEKYKKSLTDVTLAQIGFQKSLDEAAAKDAERVRLSVERGKALIEGLKDKQYALLEEEMIVAQLTELWEQFLQMQGKGISPEEWEELGTQLDGLTFALDNVDALFESLGVSADSTLRRVTQGLADVTNAAAGFAQAMAGNLFEQIGAGIGLAATAIGVVGGFVRDVEWEKVNDLRDDFMEGAGGIDALRERAHAAGLTLDDLLDARRVEDFDKAVALLEGRMEFIESMGGLKSLRDQAEAAHISLDGLFSAQSARQLSAEIDHVQQQLGLWNDANEKLNAAVDKYGFTIEELGPKFAQQKLDEQFGQLFQDYQLLTAAGVDHNAILERMGPSFSEYVNSAIAAGGTIPEAMRPAIEAMIENGTLLDANGKAFESVEATGISFAQTLEEGISKLVDKVTDLVNALLGIPTDISTNINVGTNGLPNLPGGDPFDGLPHFARGGRTGPRSESDPFTLRDGGFLGVLHPNETVVPDAQLGAFVDANVGASGVVQELAAAVREVRASVREIAERPTATLQFAPTLNNTESPFATEQGKAEAKLHTQAAFKQMLRDLEPDVQHLLKRAVGNK